MPRYSHRERLQMIIAGERPDRYAASFWRHFYHLEHHAEGTVEAMLEFQKRFDWDFMKINPRADYHVEDWGLRQHWSHDEFRKHTKTDFPVRTPDDWLRIEPLAPTAPVLAEHLTVVSKIRRRSDRELPILMTVFTPLAVAGRLVEENGLLADHLRTAPEKVEVALRAITDTFVRYVSELRNAGADGLFYATTQWASRDLLTWQEYERFGVPYDLEVIRAAEADALNLLHVCSGSNYLKELSDLEYNASLYNWDASEPTNLPLDKAQLRRGAVVGGADQRGWLLQGTPDEVSRMIEKLKADNDPSRLIIGPGCSIPPETPMENLKAVKDTL
ncbi:MAG TPA: uroporphyrinogen decarboxylase family protein [Acidobacteriota bacterium]|nr:uroporphyrinogen decarboxylase family protein [Acidobacteriota bacterium]